METETSKFKLVLLGVFGFLIVLGLVSFATFRASNNANANVEIAVWGTMDKTVFDTFTTQYKDQKVVEFKLTYTQKSLDGIDAELVEAIATGRAPDVILVPQELIKRYIDKVTFITSIDVRTFRDTFVQQSEIYLTPQGIFALPFFVDPLVMYWNRDLFASAGIAKPPVYWSDFPLLTPKLSRADTGGNISRSLAALGEYRNIDNAKALVSALIQQAGSPIIAYEGENLRPFLGANPQNQPLVPAVSALNFYTEFSDPKKAVYSWNRSITSAKQFFLSGNLATYFGFASEATELKERNPNLNIDVAMLPQALDARTKSTYGNVYGFAFLKSSTKTAAAYSVVSQLVSADAISILLNYLYVAPARLDLIARGASDPARVVFNNSALIARAWIDPDARRTNEIFQIMVENITTGRMDSATAVGRANLELDALLK